MRARVGYACGNPRLDFVVKPSDAFLGQLDWGRKGPVRHFGANRRKA